MAKDSRFRMTDGEISNDFRLAKNKREMVEILADQNLVSPGAMARKLDELGLMEDAGLNPDTFSNTRSLPQGLTPRKSGPKPKPKAPPKSNDRPTVPPIDEIRAMELWKEGADDIAMSEALGVPITRVKEWRTRMHLRRPRGYAARKETMKTEEESPMKENAPTAATAPAPSEPLPTGVIQAEQPEVKTGWTVDDFSMAHRCIGVIEGIAEGIVSNAGAKERLLQAARTLCELMEMARIDTSQEV